MEELKSYWRVILTLLMGVGFALYSFYGQRPTDIAGLATLVALVMTSLLGLHIAESFDLKSRFGVLPENTKSAVREALREHDSAQLVTFARTADYMELFDGLQGSCYVYNPHQFAPSTADINPDEIVASTVRRYQSPDFQGIRYLICVGDEYGKQNFARFCSRLKKVHQLSQNPVRVKEKVRVGLIADKSFSQEPTYHIQRKGTERSVVELRLAPLTVSGSLIPNFYLTSTSSDLRVRLRAHFDSAWAGAKELDVAHVLHETFETNAASIAKLVS